jgi:hypothetical protein
LFLFSPYGRILCSSFDAPGVLHRSKVFTKTEGVAPMESEEFAA